MVLCFYQPSEALFSSPLHFHVSRTFALLPARIAPNLRDYRRASLSDAAIRTGSREMTRSHKGPIQDVSRGPDSLHRTGDQAPPLALPPKVVRLPETTPSSAAFARCSPPVLRCSDMLPVHRRSCPTDASPNARCGP